MQSLLQTPDNLFQLIEAIVTQDPTLLSSFHWHELPNGREAFTEEQVMEPDTKHCLAGFIVALTPNGPKFGSRRQDVDVYANEILVASGRLPIPLAIYMEDEETLTKILKGRAAEERAKAYLAPQFN
jgi:hypothetical protein